MGVFEEPPLAQMDFQDWADLTALGEPGFDVVTAVETGQRLRADAECGCLDVDGYTTDLPRSAAMLFYAGLGSGIVLALLLILATGWLL